MIPYTPDAVRTIRTLAAVSSRAAIKQTLGWSDDMLDRVARRHSIEISEASQRETQVVVEPEPKDYRPSIPRPYSRTGGTNSTSLTFAVAQHVAEALFRNAVRDGKTVSWLVRDILLDAVERDDLNARPGPLPRYAYVSVAMSRELRLTLADATSRHKLRSVATLCAALVERATK